MKDIVKLHQQVCPNCQLVLDMSLDGIQECKSSLLSADVYTVSFANCRTVYPVKIIRPINKYKVNAQEHLRLVLDDINQNNCILKNAVGDNPKRSFFRCALGSSSSFACEYCIGKAVYIYVTDQNGKKKGHLAWPSSTANAELRDIEKIKEITQKLQNGEDLTRDECMGFWGTSHLLNQPNFNFIDNISAEYMHSACIGAVKRLLELTFNIGDNRSRNTKRKLSDAKIYNLKISSVKVIREFSRRLRQLDFGVMKAQEFRNLILFFFPIVLDCIPDEYKQEKKVWLQLTFILRACVLPNNEFEHISNNVIRDVATSFYKNYEAIYGKKNCTYSIHLIAAHILDIRGQVPLTDRSAFKYENFYSELHNLFQPGTISPTKQMLRNCYMKRHLEKHNCVKSNFYDIEKKGRENNSLIYYMDENNQYKFFKIVEKLDENSFMCNPQGRFTFRNEILKDIKWEKIGVFTVGPYNNDLIKINRNQIHGKVIKVNNFFVTCPNNVLQEK